MKAIETGFEGLFILEPTIFEDKRGHFFESYSQKSLKDLTGFANLFIQDNQSRSSYGVLRGLHFQTGEFAQTKLVRVLFGEVLDVVVDIRPESKTYGQHFSVKLSDENRLQLLIPRGFAHGLVVLSDVVDFFYKCDNFYSPSHEGGIHYGSMDIDWILPKPNLIISDKDQILPYFESIVKEKDI